MSSKIAKSEKWYKPYDPIIWISLLVIFIAFTVYQDNSSGYNYKEIPFNKDITTIKEALDETDKIIKDKYGNRYKLSSISGYSNNLQSGTNIQPDLEISYLKVKGLSRRMIDYSVSLEDDKIKSSYVTANSVLEANLSDNYNPQKLDISHILSMVESKVDMEKVRSGYEPSLNFNIYNDEMNINIEYYKNMKNSGADYDSRVGYRFTVDLKTQNIKAESVEGVN